MPSRRVQSPAQSRHGGAHRLLPDEQQVVALLGFGSDRFLGRLVFRLAHRDRNRGGGRVRSSWDRALSAAARTTSGCFLAVSAAASISGATGVAGRAAGAGLSSDSTVVGVPRRPAMKPASWAANLPFGLSSAATSRRSILETKPFFSNSSRSSRSRSSSVIGTRASAQRSIGGIAMVVTNAMATIMVNRFWVSAPIDRPTVATMTSVEPRAFMPQPSASASRRSRPPILPPMNAPANLPMLAMAISPSASSSRCEVRQHGEVGREPGQAEEHRHEECDDQAAQLLVDVPGQDRRFADQHAGDEGAEHGVHADRDA